MREPAAASAAGAGANSRVSALYVQTVTEIYVSTTTREFKRSLAVVLHQADGNDAV
jgi:hypothetical protein